MQGHFIMGSPWDVKWSIVLWFLARIVSFVYLRGILRYQYHLGHGETFRSRTVTQTNKSYLSEDWLGWDLEIHQMHQKYWQSATIQQTSADTNLERPTSTKQDLLLLLCVVALVWDHSLQVTEMDLSSWCLISKPTCFINFYMIDYAYTCLLAA